MLPIKQIPKIRSFGLQITLSIIIPVAFIILGIKLGIFAFDQLKGKDRSDIGVSMYQFEGVAILGSLFTYFFTCLIGMMGLYFVLSDKRFMYIAFIVNCIPVTFTLFIFNL